MSAFTEANRVAFDESASTYDTKPWQKALSAQIIEALRARREWISPMLLDPERRDKKDEDDEKQVKLLDFAAGTGNVSRALEPFVTQTRAIDLSPQMVSLYNTAFQGSGTYALSGDLLDPSGVPEQFTTPEFSNFDLAVIGLGFHHFENPALALSRLAERLKSLTGVLVIVDFLPFSPHNHNNHNDDNSEDMQKTIKHHGFSPEELQNLFTTAGFIDFEILALKQPAVMENKRGEMMERKMFIAKGRKAGSVWERVGAWMGGMQELVGGQMHVQKRDGGQGWNPGVNKPVEGGGSGGETGWNPGVRPAEGGGSGEAWDMLGGSSAGRRQVEREEKKHWNGF